jgi:uncharacterized membrane protein YozB (DUF420 family)
MDLKKLEKVKIVIGIWLWFDIIGSLIYLMVDLLKNGNVLLAFLISLGAVFLPLVIYLLTDAIHIAFKSIDEKQ